MKKLFAAAILSTAMASTVFAIPYASGIKVSSTSVSEGAGLTINYNLNEAADAVTIEVLDSSNAVVATFAGTATAGANSVVWNGTTDNASGTDLAIGTGYKVRVEADKNAAAGWTIVRSHRSLGAFGQAADQEVIFAGFSPNAMLSVKNPASEFFGKLVVNSTYLNATQGNAVAVPFESDLTLSPGYDGSYANRVIKGLADALNATGVGGGNNVLWGISLDPDDLSTIYGAGQLPAGNEIGSANLATPSTAFIDADNGLAVTNPRSITVANVGSSKFAFTSRGGSITRTAMTGTQLTTGATLDAIVGAYLKYDGVTAGAYAKDIQLDADGNLYFATQISNKVFRWDAAQVATATAGSLTEANATWNVLLPLGASTDATVDRAMFIRVSGDATAGGPRVYVSTTLGVYDLGLASQATNTTAKIDTDKIIAFDAPLYGSTQAGRATYSPPIAVDYVGNIYVGDRSNEHIRLYSPGGNTSIPVTATASQAFDITAASLSSEGWQKYE